MGGRRHHVNWSPCKPNSTIHLAFGVQANTLDDVISNSVVHNKQDGTLLSTRRWKNLSSNILRLGPFFRNTESRGGGMVMLTTSTSFPSPSRSSATQRRKVDLVLSHIVAKSTPTARFT